MKLPKRLFPLLVFIALLSYGCRTKPLPPNPGDTVLGGQAGERVDWVSAKAIYGDDAPELRDRGFAAGRGLEGDVLSSVFFDYDRSVIKVSEREKLREVAEQLVSNPLQKLLIEGHCDWRGTTEYNLGLGDRRANSVMEYLMALGVSDGQMETNSKGDLEAVVEGSDEDRVHDRRSDLIILR